MKVIFWLAIASAIAISACTKQEFSSLQGSKLEAGARASGISDDQAAEQIDDVVSSPESETEIAAAESDYECHKYSGRDEFRDPSDPDQYRDLVEIINDYGGSVTAEQIATRVTAVVAQNGENLNRKVSVCHISPSGSSEEMCISLRALKVHMDLIKKDMKDYLGECSDEKTNACLSE